MRANGIQGAKRRGKPTGGSSGKIDFQALIQNYGTQPVRAKIAASVNTKPVTCRPEVLNLLVNKEPSYVTIAVPRPDLGDLVPQFNNETTLYGRELAFEVRVDDEVIAAETWREPSRV